jgi:hypothetical protein
VKAQRAYQTVSKQSCNKLESFCNHLQSSSDALVQSIHHRPVPFNSAASTFEQWLNRRISTSSADLELLDSMSSTVSFEELLGNCNELYKKNQTDLIDLEDRLKSCYGYVPVPEIEEGERDVQAPQVSDDKWDSPSSFYGSLSMADLRHFQYSCVNPSS